MQRKEGEVKKKSLCLHIIFSCKKELGGLQLICLALTDQFCTLDWKNCAVPAIAKTAAVVSISRIAVFFSPVWVKMNYQGNTKSDIKLCITLWQSNYWQNPTKYATNTTKLVYIHLLFTNKRNAYFGYHWRYVFNLSGRHLITQLNFVS